jgi:hypothetical protein
VNAYGEALFLINGSSRCWPLAQSVPHALLLLLLHVSPLSLLNISLYGAANVIASKQSQPAKLGAVTYIIIQLRNLHNKDYTTQHRRIPH